MKRYLKTIAGVLGLLFLFPVALNAQDSRWLNGFGGDFHNAAHWSNGVPGTSENAVFDLPVTYSVDLTADHHVNGLNLNAGQLTFTGGHELTVTEWSTIDQRTTITGLNTHLNYQQVLTIFNSPAFDIEQGATLQADSLRISPYHGSSDTITLSDLDSEVRCNELHLGSVDGLQLGGTATFVLDDNARVIVGEDNDYNADVIVERSDGIPAEFTITNGSQFLFEGTNRKPIRVGTDASSEGILRVADPGSVLSAPNKLIYIGYSGTGSFAIENEAQVDADSVFIGYIPGSEGTFTMNGLGTTLNAFSLTISLGGNASATIDDFAEIDVFKLSIGAGDDPAYMYVMNGAHCDADYAYIGTDVGTGALSVIQGGTLQANHLLTLADHVDATGIINITGAGSRLTADELYLGANWSGNDGGVAHLFVGGGGSLVVGDVVPILTDTNIFVVGTNQAYMLVNDESFVDNTGDAYVGNSSLTYGTAEITGLNAHWYNEGSFFIGNYGEGEVFVNDGRLTANGTVEINDVSSLEVNYGTVEAGQGFLVDGIISMNGGTLVGDVELLTSGRLEIESDATIDGSIIHAGGEIEIENGVVLTVLENQTGNWDYSGLGAVHIEGNVDFGATPQSSNFTGSIHLGNQSTWHVKLGGEAPGAFDSMDTERFTTAPGARIDVSLTNGFTFAPGQEFVILTRNTGADPFGSFAEGDIVASQFGYNIRITYTAGDGNDIALYTAGVVGVEPQSLSVERGNLIFGAIQKLQQQDNQDISIHRNPIDLQGRIEFQMEGISPTNSPNSMEIGIEGSVFARSEVIQTVFLYDFQLGQWEEIDARPASQFTDRTDTIPLSGNLSRFVNQSNRKMRARVRFVSTRSRQWYASNTDFFSWRIEM